MGGPCKYQIIDKYVNDDFILNYVVPKMKERVCKNVCIILGTALLYFCFTNQADCQVPHSILSCVHSAFGAIERRAEDPVPVNPVRKIVLILSGQEGEVYLDEAVEEETVVGGRNDEVLGAGQRPASITDRPTREQLRALHSQLAAVKAAIHRLERRMEEDKVFSNRNYLSLQANIKRIALSPGKPIGRDTTQLRHVPNQVSLSSNPRTIYDLWDEYTLGLGGRKAAKEYTPRERGKVKYKYTRRKVVWDTISMLPNSGLHLHVATKKEYIITMGGTRQ